MKRLIVTSSLAFALSCGAAFAQTADPQQAPRRGSPPMEARTRLPCTTAITAPTRSGRRK